MQYYQTKDVLEINGIDPGSPLPEWYQLFPEGIMEFADGPRVLVDEAAFKRVVAHLAKRGVDLVFDYEHQTRAVPPVPAPAAGWCKELRWDDGIWGRVVWTAKGEEHLRNLEYRHFSNGMFLKDQGSGRPKLLMGLDHVALTNVPRVNNNKPLIAKSELAEDEQITTDNGMELLKSLVALTGLGLSEGATEEDAVMAVKGLLAAVADKEEKNGEVPAELAKALGLEKGCSVDLVTAKIELLTSQVSPADDLKLELAKLTDKVASHEAEKLLSKYDRKITPAMLEKKRADGKPFWLELAKSDPEGFKTVVESMPDQIPAPLPKTKKEAPSWSDLTPDELVIAKSFGISPEEFAKDKEVE